MQLAHARALREDFVQPWELEPLYLRRPDAEINWVTRDGHVSERSASGRRAPGRGPREACPAPGEGPATSAPATAA